jgi:hypothetical protein
MPRQVMGVSPPLRRCRPRAERPEVSTRIRTSFPAPPTKAQATLGGSCGSFKFRHAHKSAVGSALRMTGDLAPKTLLARTLAILIGMCGVLLTALLAGVAVKALTAGSEDGD